MQSIGNQILAAVKEKHPKCFHPRIMMTEADFIRLRENKDKGLTKNLVNKVMEKADSFLDQPPRIYEIPDGVRLLHTSRAMQWRLFFLCFAYRITDDEKYAARAVEEIKAAAAFPDWHPRHFLDCAELSSNFFNLEIPKSNLFEKRMKMRTSGWRAKTDEKEQVNYLIHFMNIMLANTVDKNNKWEYIVASLRTQPVLQAIRKVYSTLEPWKNFSDDPWKQHYYQLNVDLLFEQLINACNVDRLTINTLQEHLHNSIVSQVSVDSRTPSMDERDMAIQCITVHKSKGLEYGHVIMPFCSASINYIKKTQLHVSTVKKGNRYQIGYSMSVGGTGETVRNDYYDESVEQSEKAREEARVLYVAMTRAIRSFSWIAIEGKQNLSWQNLIETEV